MMDMFSQTEILLMIGVVGTLFVVITILTILDIRDYLHNKNIDVQEEYEFGEEIQKEELIEPKTSLEPIEILEVNDNDEILISDIEEECIEPIIEEFPVSENADVIVKNEETVKKEENKVNIQEELNKALDTIPNEDSIVTSFEEEQERTAIISLDELMNRSDALYSDNEFVQYDDGNEPISIDEVINMFNKNEEEKEVPELMQDIVNDKKEVYTHKENIPFISSVYGIETDNSLEFENTATYEKLSRSKKNEFMTKLREINENK